MAIFEHCRRPRRRTHRTLKTDSQSRNRAASTDGQVLFDRRDLELQPAMPKSVDVATNGVITGIVGGTEARVVQNGPLGLELGSSMRADYERATGGPEYLGGIMKTVTVEQTYW